MRHAQPLETIRLRKIGSLLVALAMIVVSLIAATPGELYAQDDAVDTLERIVEQEEATLKTPVPASSIEPVTLRVHWRLWKRVISEGKPGTAELRAVRDDLASLGIINEPAMTLAAIEWLDRAHRDKDIPTAQAGKAWEALMILSPQMPHVPLARARFLFKHQPTELKGLSQSISQGLRRAISWYPTSQPLGLNLLIYGLLAAALAGTIFLLAQIVRYFSTLAYDAARLLPSGFSTNQTVIALLALIILPGLFLQSPLTSGLIMLTLLGLVQQWHERIVTVALLGLVALLPSLEGELNARISFMESEAGALFEAQYTSCDRACQDRLSAIVESSKGELEPLVTYTQLLNTYRSGKTDKVLTQVTPEEIAKWSKPLSGLGLNLYGASMVAQAKSAEAIEHLDRASALMPTSAAPSINKMRAHQMEQERDRALKALEVANTRALLETVDFLKNKQRDVNSFLWVEPAPLELFGQHHARALAKAPPKLQIIGRFWPFMAGSKLPLSLALYLGLGGALLVLLTLPLSLRGALSTPCPRCGLARDPEDGAHSGDHPYCDACYKTFVTGATMEYHARVASEERINQRSGLARTTRRLLAFIAPGAGHATAGHAVVGFLISLVVSGALLWWMRPEGIWRGPQELLRRDWYGIGALLGILGGAGLLASWWVAWRDIDVIFVRTRKHKSSTSPTEQSR